MNLNAPLPPTCKLSQPFFYIFITNNPYGINMRGENYWRRRHRGRF